jgi:hypothetical protein
MGYVIWNMAYEICKWIWIAISTKYEHGAEMLRMRRVCYMSVESSCIKVCAVWMCFTK